MKFTFNIRYFLWFCFLFIVESMIAIFVNDAWIRPFLGDFLVVILVYCFVKSFFNTKLIPTLIGVLLFSYLIETLQYFHFVERVGLQQITIARVMIGTYFSWVDILMYTLGVIFTGLIEMLLTTNKSK